MNENKIDWNNIYKIRIANPDLSFEKHEVVKTLLVMKLLNKYKKDRRWIRIYTEMPITEKIICDVYFENIKSKEIYCFEIQKKVTNYWKEKKKKDYEEYKPILSEKLDWFIVDINKLSNDLNELSKQLDKFIV